MTERSLSRRVHRQLDDAVTAIKSSLGDNALAIYLYGSAISGGLKPASDLDMFVVLERATTADERSGLFHALTAISAKRARPTGWRPLELTGAVRATLDPLSDPPVTDFQFGEWLRDRTDAGVTEPDNANNPDLALLVAMVRQSGRPLFGPEPAELIGEVEPDRLRWALLDVVPDLLGDLESDTANVLLTLARVAYTLETGSFAAKDVAAERVLPGLSTSARPAVERARSVYLGAESDTWDGLEAAVRDAATELQVVIRSERPRG